MEVEEPHVNHASRSRLVASLVDQLDHEPFQPIHRKAPHGPPVQGWRARLESYFWPDPTTDYIHTTRLMQPWFTRAGRLSRILIDGAAWTPDQRSEATELAWTMLEWGRVTRQRAFSPGTVERVFRKALGLDVQGPVPMNSGWTKVAALATAFREDHPSASPHVIWDSRVSTAVTTRLERLMLAEGLSQPKRLFPHIGPVPGRGGTRPRPRNLRWAHAYQRWESQIRGSELIREVRDELNRRDLAMPHPIDGERTWTVRGVESVLFMDGY